MDGARLLSVGALTQDTIYRLASLPPGPGKFIPDAAVQIAAGMATAAAIAAARLGGRVALWASVGDDLIADVVVQEIAAEGVETGLIRRVPGGRTAVAAILVDATGERMIVPFYAPATQAPPGALGFDVAGRFDAVLADVRWPDAAAPALDAARAAGIPAVLDADVAARPVLERLIPLATHIAASQPAAAILFGGDTDTREATARLAAISAGVVMITDGGNGTFWYDRAQSAVRHAPAPRITAVDTLSAGDVFHGALALAFGEGQPLEDAIRFASAAAAIKCTRFGGRLGAPTRAETLTFLREWTP